MHRSPTDIPPQGVLSKCELNEIADSFVQQRGDDEIELQAFELLRKRDAVTEWERGQRDMGNKRFILGHHRLFSAIKSGGVYSIYRAQHLFHGRVDAVKILRPDRSSRRDVKCHFDRTRKQSSIRCAHLAHLYDAGYSSGAHFAVCEFLAGRDLRDLVRCSGPMGIGDAASVAIQVASALDALHQADCVHGTLWPAKIIVNESGVARITDVGSARPPGLFDMSKDACGIQADYICPDVLRGEISCTSDIYLLGCVLYFAVTGVVPFPRGGVKQKAALHFSTFPLDPKRIRPDLDDEFVALLAEMMAKLPADRVTTADEAITRLKQWAK